MSMQDSCDLCLKRTNRLIEEIEAELHSVPLFLKGDLAEGYEEILEAELIRMQKLKKKLYMLSVQ